MVLKPEPLAEALNSLGISTREGGKLPIRPRRSATRRSHVCPRMRFTQAVAREFASLERIVMICGRYEGVDERISQIYCDMELSIGDYVLSGGELAAAVIMDSVIRLIPGVLGNEASGEFESFGVADTDITTDMDGVPRSQHGAGGCLTIRITHGPPSLADCARRRCF